MGAPEKQKQGRRNTRPSRVTLTEVYCLRKSGSFNSEYESFFGKQYFGGDDLPPVGGDNLPPKLADTSLPAPPVSVRPSEAEQDYNQVERLDSIDSLTTCQVANAK